MFMFKVYGCMRLMRLHMSAIRAGSVVVVRPWRAASGQGSTTLQCALEFCCPRSMCTEVLQG
jgi:hypothetical protein